MIKILNGIEETVDFKNDSYLMLYDNKKYEEYPTHWHTPIEIIMPQEGEYKLECNGLSYVLKVNDIIIIAPCTLHHLHASQGKRIIFQADMKLLNMYKELDSLFPFIQPALLITPETFPAIHEQAKNILLDIKREYLSNTPLKNLAIYTKLLTLFLILGRDFTNDPDRFSCISPFKQQEYTNKISYICEYINDHCTEELCLDDMAKMTGFSKYHFSRLFKEFTNISFYKYVNLKKIHYAEKLMLDHKISLSEVALKSGYNSISSFMRMFKIIKGCTPTEFKKMKDPRLNDPEDISIDSLNIK
ncbi:MAG: AraC family transcriptional regulator [Lachnospiraceae bacterium]|nr:AraC family transcriptional regulator [Lachnospiraceae bacterium]